VIPPTISGTHEEDPDPLPLSTYTKEVAFDDASQLMAFLGGDQFRRGRWIFRGQSNATWLLQPLLERFANGLRELPSAVEQYVDAEFRRNAHHYISDPPANDDILGWLALMRHYGAPTRFLDFSKSPYVAAFFATADAKPCETAAIWAIDGVTIRHHAGALLAEQSMSVVVKQHGEQCLRTPGYSFSDPKVFREVFEGGTLGSRGAVPARVVIPIEPFRTNDRAFLQQGVFLCPVTLVIPFERALRDVVRHAKETPASAENVLYKISISPGAHPNVLRELHRMNINYATLQPGLDGLARALATVCKIRASTVPAERPPDYEFGIRF
jgi:hypothetical protein